MQALRIEMLGGGPLPEFPPMPTVWYCLVVRDGMVAKITDDLERMGLRAYAPRGKALKTIRRRGGAWRTVPTVRLVFPGYLFVGVPGLVDWQAIRDLSGVLAYVGTENPDGDHTPLRIPQSEIVKLQERAVRGEFDWDYSRPKESKFGIVKNDRVIMRDGVLAQYTGVVRREPTSRTVEVEPDLFPSTVIHIDISKIDVVA